jgi:hypothetical protein
MQDKQLFKEFVAFCQSQPKDKPIDHSSWKTCAVGDFAATKGLSIQSGVICLTEKSKALNPDLPLITPEERIFFESLIGELTDHWINASSLLRLLASGKRYLLGPDIATYGEFSDILSKFNQ